MADPGETDDIHLEAHPEIFRRNLPDVGSIRRHDGGIIINDVDLAGLLQRRVEQTVDLGLVGELAGHGYDLDAGAFELGGERLGVGQLTAVQDEVGTELGEALTDVSADPAARAGDE